MKKGVWIALIIIAIVVVLLIFTNCFSSKCKLIERHINFTNNSAFCQNILNNNYFKNENFTLQKGSPYFDDPSNSAFLEIVLLSEKNVHPVKYSMLCKPSMKEPVKINCRYQGDKPGYVGGWFGVDAFLCQDEGVYFVNYYGDPGKQFVGPFNLTTDQFVEA